MKDINWPLRQAYNTALTGMEVPIYYQSAPPNYTDDYIVLRGINSNDVSPKTNSDTSTTIIVEINTHNNGTNPGYTADSLANDVYLRIYPTPDFNLSIPGFQCVSTRVASDVTRDVIVRNNRSYISRFITFRHVIFISNNELS